MGQFPQDLELKKRLVMPLAKLNFLPYPTVAPGTVTVLLFVIVSREKQPRRLIPLPYNYLSQFFFFFNCVRVIFFSSFSLSLFSLSDNLYMEDPL